MGKVCCFPILSSGFNQTTKNKIKNTQPKINSKPSLLIFKAVKVPNKAPTSDKIIKGKIGILNNKIGNYIEALGYLNDYEIAIIKDGQFFLSDSKNVPLTPYIQKLDMELEAIEKGGFEHFMLKEIYEQPKSIADCLRGRLDAKSGRVVLGGLRDYMNKFELWINNVLIVARRIV